MLTEDLQQDRRMIQKKLQQRRRTQLRNSKKAAMAAAAADAAARGGGSDNSNNGVESSERTGSHRSGGNISRQQSIESVDDIALLEDDFYNQALDEDLRNMRSAHAHDEQLIGGRIEDGGDEGLEAMNQALTSPPVAWWAMRKQWQKRRGNMLNFVGLGNGAATSEGGDDDDYPDGPDSSYRRGHLLEAATTAEAGVVGHPVMLEDPAAMGYDESAFRQNPYAVVDNKRKRKGAPTVLFVSRDVLQKRKMLQGMYIVAALCVVFLFMFILEQRKLSHYAMVESPMSLSAYLAGDALMTANRDEHGESKNKVMLGDLGLEEFDKVHGIPQVEFGNIEVDPNDPLSNEELAHDPLVGNVPKVPPNDEGFSHVHGAARFDLLKGVVVGWGIMPSEIFENHQSPQYRALSWMAHDDVLRYTPDNDHWIKKIVQRYTLAVLYYSTDGPGWTNTLFFLSNFDECNWNRKYMGYYSGVGHCDGGFITVLALWSNNLSGGEYDCRGISCRIVSFMYAEHNHSHLILLLSYFVLAQNFLALPPEVGSLTSLRTFSVFDNHLNVAPPKSMANLKGLTRLYFQRNKFPHGTDIGYLCPNRIGKLKSDCGRQGGVTCECCTTCGYNSRTDKGSMVDRFHAH